MNIFVKNFLAAGLILSAVIGATGCSFIPGKSSATELLPGWNKETVEISLPAYPAETHPPLVGWKLVHRGNGGTSEAVIPPSESAVHVRVQKNRPTPILLYPLTELSGTTASFFHPAGCVYPYSRQASWQEGFTAEFFYQLARTKSDDELDTSPLLRFNWPRLTQQTERRFREAQEKGKIFSPWFLQEEVLREAVVQGSVSTRNIKQQDLMEISLEEVAAATTKSESSGTAEAQPQHGALFYRYIPLGVAESSLTFPKATDYAVHQENAFWGGDRILSVFTKKNQKPVLATTGIERYTDGR